MLTHIFETHGLSDNYISFLLDRKGDPTASFKGQLTVSEVIPGFENITSMPKIDVDKVNRLLKAGAFAILLFTHTHGRPTIKMWVDRSTLANFDGQRRRDHWS